MNSLLSIRPLATMDLEACRRIEGDATLRAVAMDGSWPRLMKAFMEERAWGVVGIDDCHSIAGFMLCGTLPKSRSTIIYKAAVRPMWQRAGLGAALLDRVIASAKNARHQNVWVHLSDVFLPNAHRLVARSGFVLSNYHRHYDTWVASYRLRLVKPSAVAVKGG